MRKSPLSLLIVSMCFLFGYSVAYSNSCAAGMKHCTKHHYDFAPNLAANGCSRLNVTIENKTNYYFSWDQAYAGAVNEGNVIDASSGAVSTTPIVISPASGENLIVLQGAESGDDHDEVDKMLHFVAYFTDPTLDSSAKKTGADFVVQVTKNSCNAVLTTCQKEDHPCYCKGDSGGSCVDAEQTCSKAWYNDPYSSASYYEPLHSEDHYWSADGATNCDKATLTDSGNLKANIFLAESKATYIDLVSSQAALFDCGKETVCNADATENVPATVSFSVQPAPIETLTVTLPFNAKTPMAQVMKDSIYNNLNAKYVGQLGSYFSFSPVVMADTEQGTELRFSTLCSYAGCPQASS